MTKELDRKLKEIRSIPTNGSLYWNPDNPIRKQRFFTELLSDGKYIIMELGPMNVHWPVRNVEGEVLRMDNWEQVTTIMDYIDN